MQADPLSCGGWSREAQTEVARVLGPVQTLDSIRVLVWARLGTL